MAELKKIRDDIRNEIKGGKEIYAFPMNYSYVDLDKLWLEIQNTGIQNIFEDDISYVLAVSIFPYPNYILSMWVFVGVLV